MATEAKLASGPIRNHAGAALGALAAALGITIMAGGRVVPGFPSMVLASALSFTLLGGALLVSGAGRGVRVARAAAGLIVVFSLRTLIEYGGGAAAHGWPAPNTALCFLLVSVAVLLISGVMRFGRRPLLLGFLGSVVAGLGCISLAGRLTGFETFRWNPTAPMAFDTSFGFALLGASVLAFAWRDGRAGESGAPPWSFAPAALAVVVVSFSLWQALAADERGHVERAIAANLAQVKSGILSEMRYRIEGLARNASRWGHSGPPRREDWEYDAGLLLHDFHGYQVIRWVDPDLRIRWVAPREGNEQLVGVDMGSDPARRVAFESARRLRVPVTTHLVDLLAGGRGVNVYAPIYRGDVFEGFVGAGFRLQDLLDQILGNRIAPGFAVAVFDGGERLYLRPGADARLERGWSRQGEVQLADATWTIKIWPTPEVMAGLQSRNPEIVLGIGLLLAALLGVAVYLAQTAGMRRRLAERLRTEMEREVADRRRAEQELDEFFTLSLDMLCIAGFDGYFKRLNPAWERALAVPVQELLAEPFLDFVHPDDREATRAAAGQLAKGGEVICFENRYRTRDGSYRWMRWSCKPVVERQLIFAAARDVTEERGNQEALRRARDELEMRVRERTAQLEAANQSLRASEEQFRRLFEDSPMGTVLGDRDARFLRVNRAFCQMLGYTEQELIGRSADELTHPDDIEPNVPLRERMFAGELGSFHTEKRYLKKNGEPLWIGLTATTIRREDGTPLYGLGMLENIQERKAKDEKIRLLNRQLEDRVSELTELNQELEAFTYSVSHDLRAPLRHIDGFSKRLLEEYGPELAENARRYLDKIRQGSQRMGRMVDELLELSRTSRREPVKQLTGLGKLVQEVIAELQPEIQGREIEWRIGELPFADCDPALLRQVFVNLLANAVKFSRARRPAVIEAGQMLVGGQPAIFVRDNGVGFSMKYADKLFGVFQRLHRAEDFEGTGVGLATVQRIIHKHGGRIWAEAELDRGASFYFTLEAPGAAQAEAGVETLAGRMA